VACYLYSLTTAVSVSQEACV